MKKKPESEYVHCCALCEYCMPLEIKEKYLCKYKGRLAETEPDDVCRHFELDLLKMEPIPKRPYTPEL